MAKRTNGGAGQAGGHVTPEDGAADAAADRIEAQVAARTRLARADRALRRAEPGCDGRRALIADSVQSPYDPARRDTVMRNVRHDPVEQLYQQRDRKGRRLIDEPERLAGIEIRRMVEALGLDAVRTIELGERVDGGGRYYDIGARRYEAGKRVRKLRRLLGRRAFDVLMRVVGYGETITIVAADYERDDEARANGACAQKTREHIGWLFRESLVEAATALGYRPMPRRGGIVGFRADGARPAIDP